MGFILLLVVAGIVLNVLFWGFIAYLVIKLFGNASPQQLSQVASALAQHSRSQSAFTPVADSVRSMAAQNGIDLNS